VDSLLVANQIGGSYEAKEASMKQYLVKAQELINSFDNCVVIHVPRSKNKKADALSKLASVTFSHLAKDIRVEVLEAPSISEVEVRAITEENRESWMTPIIQYLSAGVLPGNKGSNKGQDKIFAV
jgi:hypothetical protein